MSDTATSKQLYQRYHEAVSSGNDKLKASYLLLLKNRASYGSAEAQKYVDKIEGRTK